MITGFDPWPSPKEMQEAALKKLADGATGAEAEAAEQTARRLNALIEPPKASTIPPELMATWEAMMPSNHRPYGGKPPRDLGD